MHASLASLEKSAEDKKKAAKEWKKNRPEKLKFSFKEQKEFETIDDVISSLEEKIENLDQEILKNATNSLKLQELMKEKGDAGCYQNCLYFGLSVHQVPGYSADNRPYLR